MSALYQDLPYTNFPDAEDPLVVYQDVSATTKPIVDSYLNAVQEGNFTLADRLYQENPALAEIVFTSEMQNRIYQAVIAMERYCSTTLNFGQAVVEIQAAMRTLAKVAKTGEYGDLNGKPASLPANGGNADTVDNKHAADLQNYNNLTNKPSSLPANGGNADTVDGKHASELMDYRNLTNKPTSIIASGGNSDTVDNKHASDFMQKGVDYVTAGQTAGIAIGSKATAEGWSGKATGSYSHAEGTNCTSNGPGSHAEGADAYADGSYSHAEGAESITASWASHAENDTAFAGFCSHAEGIRCVSSGLVYKVSDTDNSTQTVTLDGNGCSPDAPDSYNGIKQDSRVAIIGTYPEHIGIYNVSSVDGNAVTLGTCIRYGGSLAEFDPSINDWVYMIDMNYYSALARYANHAEGAYTVSCGKASHAEGKTTLSSGHASHAEGGDSVASGNWSHSEGYQSNATGRAAHAEGGTNASGQFSHSEGWNTTASNFASHSGGHYSRAMTNGGTSSNKTGDAFVIGNGTGTSALSNAFRVNYAGSVYGLSAFNSTGADYAEYFEWEDQNPDREDRAGYFVTMSLNKIRIADENDDYVLGIVSGLPALIGNSDEDYAHRWEKDDFGRFKTREVITEVTREEPELDDDGKPTGKMTDVPTGETIVGMDYVPNPGYDPDREYVERKDRPEWSAVGMLGVLSVRDDGTCIPDSYCKPTAGGIATAADKEYDIRVNQGTGEMTFRKHYRVLERVSDNVVKVLVK